MTKRLALSLLFLVPAIAMAAPPVSPCDSSGNCAAYDSSGRTSVAPGSNPCQSPGATLVSAFGSTSGTAAVEIVAAVASSKIYICSLVVVGVSGTTPTFSLVHGTGTNCGTGQTVVLGAWTNAANTVYSFPFPLAIVPASGALCYLQTGTTPINRYLITYVQQP